MKKTLLASAAVLAAWGFSANAAEPLKLQISGEMTQYFGYANQDVDRADVDQQGDADIIFSGETKLDNGLSVGVLVDMNATQGEDSASVAGNKNVKYAYAWVSGRYGKISLGQQENVGALIHHSAPAFGLGSQDGDWMNWVDASNNRAVQTTYVNDDEAADKINIFTPVWNGFQAAFTYVPDTKLSNTGATSMAPKYVTTTPSGTSTKSSSGDLYAVGVAYENEFSNGVGVGADVAYIVGNVVAADTGYSGEFDFSAIQTGLNVTYSGFTFGGSYLNRSTNGGAFTKAVVGAGNSWDVGVAYENGPWGVSLSYFDARTRANLGGSGKDKARSIALAGKYDIGPGVELNGTIAKVDYDTYSGNGGKDADGERADNSGWAVVTGVRVAF